MPTNYWLKFGNTPLGYNGSGVQYTHVEQPGQLVISLNGIGTGFDTAKNFNVLVTFGSAISYTVDGTPVATPSATCTLTLHAGQVRVVGNIPFGTTFVISETVTDEGYELQSITVPSGTMTDGGTIHSVVNNVYHAPGTLTVGVSMSGSGYDPTKTFGFVVTFGRAISYSINGTPVSSPTNTYSGSLTSGSSVVLGNIPSGVSYSVAESPLSQQDRDDGYSTGTVTNGSGTMGDGGSITATAGYAYVKPPTASLTITRSDTDHYYSSNTATITLSKAVKYTVDGVTVSTPSNTITLSMERGQSIALTDLPTGQIVIVANQSGNIQVKYKTAAGVETQAQYSATGGAYINGYADYVATAKLSLIA